MIFAKAPIPGQVKTRLCPPLTADEAASLHGSFVLDMLERTGVAVKKGRSRLDRFLACAPSKEHVFFKVMEDRYGVSLIDQIGDDLGARMDHAFADIFARGYQQAVLVGTDLPTLPESSIAQALVLLKNSDLVLGPSFDGGYFMIGLNRPAPQLFVDIPWSTDQVLADTQRKAAMLGLKTALLSTQRDVDTVDDLRALIHECGLGMKGSGHEAKTGHTASHALTSAIALSKRTAGALQLLAGRHTELMIR